jgi:hypothetical protein
MGMVSYFEDQDITVKDLEGLRNYIKLYSETFGKDGMFEGIIKKDGYVTFEDWTDIKLISYWYPNILIFLEGLARYIEGDVSWEFENHDEAGWISFREGKTIIHTGQMTYSNWEPAEEISEDICKKDQLDYGKVKQFRLLTQL